LNAIKNALAPQIIRNKGEIIKNKDKNIAAVDAKLVCHPQPLRSAHTFLHAKACLKHNVKRYDKEWFVVLQYTKVRQVR